MTDKLKVVARLGTSVQSVVLITGEMGFITDKKIFLVGDDTTEAPRIATTKSTGDLEYLKGFTPTFGNIKIHDGGTVDGVELAGIRKLKGVPVHLGDGKMRSKTLKGDEDFITVSDILSGETDEIVITLSEVFKNQVGNGLVFTSGAEFPDKEKVRPGHIHFDEQKELIYVRVRTSDNNNFWLDIGSGGGGGGGAQIFFRPTEPEEAGIGDQWVDTSSKKLYLRMQEGDNLLWIERLI